MRTFAWALALTLAVSGTTAAQDDQDRFEVGLAVAGFGVIDENFLFRIPAPVFQGSPAVYARFFATDNVFLEPELGFFYVEGDYSLEAGFGIGYRFTPEVEAGTFYAAGSIGIARTDAGPVSNNNVAPGAAAGYWFPLFDRAAAASVEARYRQWTDPDFADFTVVLKVAVLR